MNRLLARCRCFCRGAPVRRAEACSGGRNVVCEVAGRASRKVVMVDFWATYCVPCRAEMPQLVAMQAKLRDKGLQLITVSADEPEKQAEAEKFLAQRGATAPAYIKTAKDDDKFINLVDPKWSGALPGALPLRPDGAQGEDVRRRNTHEGIGSRGFEAAGFAALVHRRRISRPAWTRTFLRTHRILNVRAPSGCPASPASCPGRLHPACGGWQRGSPSRMR